MNKFILLLIMAASLLQFSNRSFAEGADAESEGRSTNCDSPLQNCPKTYDKRLTTPPESDSDKKAARLAGEAVPAKVTPAEPAKADH